MANNKNLSLHVQKHAVVMKERLEKIKKFLDKKDSKSMNPVRKECKGSGSIYPVLRELDVVYKEGELWLWKESIPVTLQLAITVAENSYSKSKQIKNKHKNSSKEVKTKEVTETNTPIVPNKVVHTAPEIEVPIKRRFSFSILWGLIKFRKG